MSSALPSPWRAPSSTRTPSRSGPKPLSWKMRVVSWAEKCAAHRDTELKGLQNEERFCKVSARTSMFVFPSLLGEVCNVTSNKKNLARRAGGPRTSKMGDVSRVFYV